MQWLQDPNPSNVDNLGNLRHEASSHSRNKRKKYSKTKIDEMVNSSKIKKNIRYL